jgi:hypothetical protein
MLTDEIKLRQTIGRVLITEMSSNGNENNEMTWNYFIVVACPNF